jgi:tRNA modification GTPase
MNPHARELTPRGHGAVSVIRVRGPGALETVLALAPRARRDVLEPQVVRLRVHEEDLDEAIVCVLSPSEVELHVHGSPPLVRRILARIRGELDTARGPSSELAPSAVRDRSVACAGGSAEERAWERLGSAASDSAARILLDQAEGALRRELRELASASPRRRAEAAAEMIERGRVARFALEPIEVALAGPVNAGKSTLFNALLGEERTIVSEQAGTTRDVIRERASFGAYPVVLIDTPGEHSPTEPCDGLGHGDPAHAALARASQRGSMRARGDAELVLWLERAESQESGASIAAPGRDGARAQLVHTQVDRLDVAERGRFPLGISALREPESARARVHAIFRAEFALPAEPWCAGRAVPFDADLLAGVRALALESPAANWERSVDSLLGAT